MSKLKSAIISGYVAGIFGQFIYLHFIHSYMKYKSVAWVLGSSLAWPIGKYSAPWWVWLITITVAIFIAFGDEITKVIEEANKNNNDKPND